MHSIRSPQLLQYCERLGWLSQPPFPPLAGINDKCHSRALVVSMQTSARCEMHTQHDDNGLSPGRDSPVHLLPRRGDRPSPIVVSIICYFCGGRGPNTVEVYLCELWRWWENNSDPEIIAFLGIRCHPAFTGIMHPLLQSRPHLYLLQLNGLTDLGHKWMYHQGWYHQLEIN